MPSCFVSYKFLEHIKSLTPEFKQIHSHIPWRNIIGLRNRIVHEYGKVDLYIVFDAVKKDIYVIHELFESIDQN
jgi:uncharacterized protein with HEPN domain